MNRPANATYTMTRTRAKVRPAATQFCKTDATERDGARRRAIGVFVRKYTHFRRFCHSGALCKALQARGLDTPIETLMSIFQRIVL
jgi:hypothetical protein